MPDEFEPPDTHALSWGDPLHRWAVVVTGGSPLGPGTADRLPTNRFVIAADSGLDHAIAAGLGADLVVGDLDSVSPAGIAWARERAVPIEVYPTDKDVTDTQLALGAALDPAVTGGRIDSVVLVGGGGDRLDHSISALTALGHPSLGTCRHVRSLWGTSLVEVLHAPGYWEFELARDTTFSLLALHGECTRVTLDGARWPLADADIDPASSLGVSNVAIDIVRVSVGSGRLSLVVPHLLTTHSRPAPPPPNSLTPGDHS